MTKIYVVVYWLNPDHCVPVAAFRKLEHAQQYVADDSEEYEIEETPLWDDD